MIFLFNKRNLAPFFVFRKKKNVFFRLIRKITNALKLIENTGKTAPARIQRH